MKKIAKFEKVSYSQFKNDFMDSFPQYNEKEVEEIYNSIQLPKRATKAVSYTHLQRLLILELHLIHYPS